MKKIDKASISNFLMQQAVDCLQQANRARNEKQILSEIQQTINVFLLLGITVEGVINEIGEQFCDSWTWVELEKASTPLKWQVVSGLKLMKPYKGSEEPLQTIASIQKIRNKIAHPKLKPQDKDIIIISETGTVLLNPKGEDKLPDGNITFYIGCKNLLKDFNARHALTYTKKVLNAIDIILNLFELRETIEWPKQVAHSINLLEISKNEFD